MTFLDIMLKFKIKEILETSGKKYPATWLKKFCDFDRNKAYKFMNNKRKAINLKDLSKLCENLHCTPNDLFYWENTGHSKVQDEHPLNTTLTKPEKNSDWYKLFKHLSPDKIIELHKQATEMVKDK